LSNDQIKIWLWIIGTVVGIFLARRYRDVLWLKWVGVIGGGLIAATSTFVAIRIFLESWDQNSDFVRFHLFFSIFVALILWIYVISAAKKLKQTHQTTASHTIKK
jgi:ABC-type enterochelin transport system permease subunit